MTELSRRAFTALSATTAGALLAGRPDRVLADRLDSVLDESTMTDRYAFLLTHVEAEFPLPTLVEFADENGVEVLSDIGVEHRTQPDYPAAHAHLTPEQAATVAAADRTEALAYAPGSNPFWRLGAYDEGVFLDPEDSVDYIAFEEARAGLTHLESEHPDRLRVTSIGSGHGHENRFEGALDPQDVWVAELTESVGAAGDRETVVFELGMHGDERAGVEAGLRFVEGVLTGEYPAVAGLLSEIRLVVVSLNPDGWVVREPLYEDPVDPPDFRRHNGADRDLNRQQPVAGWIPPDRVPGEPRGANLADDTASGIDDDTAGATADHTPGATADDVPAQVAAEVPEVLALVQHLRTYDDVTYLVDFHGMYGHTEAVLALESAGGTPRDRADSELLGRALGQALFDDLGSVANWTDVFETVVTDTADQRDEEDCTFDLLCQTPLDLFARGTPLDTIDYTTSGALADWAALPEGVGGLGATALTPEVVFSNSLPDGMEKRFLPDLVAFQVAAYGAVCRATVEHAADDIGVAVETGGRSTAYLASDDLTGRAGDLPHVDGDGVTESAAVGGASGGAVAGGPDSTLAGGSASADGRAVDGVNSTLAVDRRTLTGRGVSSTVQVPAETHTLTVEVRAAGQVVDATLRDGDGNAVDHADGSRGARGMLTALDPAAGEWQLEATVRGSETPVEVRTTRLVADGVPDPVDALGYAQRDYEVTPLSALDALGAAADAPVEAVSADAVRTGALLADGEPAYENLVVSHGDIDGAGRAALGAYVEAGGNLVLTDSGVELAGELDVAGLAAVDREDVTRQELDAAAYPDLDGAHPLAAGRRTTAEESWVDQREPWQHPPLGYARGEVPMYTVAEQPLQDAGAIVASAVEVANSAENGAGDTEGDRERAVRLATVPTEDERVGVHLLGSLLPPAAQHNLHPFGVLGHSLTTLGYLLLCNALGYRVALSRNGQQVATLGSLVDSENAAGDDAGDDGDGDSGDDGGDGEDDSDDSADTVGSADDDGPGFGPAAGAAGAGGLGYLLARHVAGSEAASEGNSGYDSGARGERDSGYDSGARGEDTRCDPGSR